MAQKSNEITTIPTLLDKVDCCGSVIGIDAIGCQKTIAVNIRDQKADYLIALKAIQ